MDPSQSEFLDQSIWQMNNLFQGVHTAAGRVMILATWAHVTCG